MKEDCELEKCVTALAANFNRVDKIQCQVNSQAETIANLESTIKLLKLECLHLRANQGVLSATIDCENQVASSITVKILEFESKRQRSVGDARYGIDSDPFWSGKFGKRYLSHLSK